MLQVAAEQTISKMRINQGASGRSGSQAWPAGKTVHATGPHVASRVGRITDEQGSSCGSWRDGEVADREWKVIPLSHVSLFTGVGGIDIAAEAAGFQTVLQVEIADYQRALLHKHWPDVTKIKDVRDVTRETYEDAIRNIRGGDDIAWEVKGHRPTVLSGGFPCSR